MSNVFELTKVYQDAETGLWVIAVLSPFAGWIPQGEHTTKEAAEKDRANWG